MTVQSCPAFLQRRTLLGVALAMSAIGRSALADDPVQPDKMNSQELTDGGKAMDEKTVETIRSLARKSIDTSTQALLSANRKSLEAEFSPAFAMAGGDWRFKGRDDLIESVSSGKVKYESIKSTVEKIDVASETVAIVKGRRSVKAVVHGEDFASTFDFTAVHVFDGGNWKVAAWGVTC